MNNTVQPFFASNASLIKTFPQKPKFVFSRQNDSVQFGNKVASSDSTTFVNPGVPSRGLSKGQSLLYDILSVLIALTIGSVPIVLAEHDKKQALACPSVARQAGINLPEGVQCENVDGQGNMKLVLPKK